VKIQTYSQEFHVQDGVVHARLSGTFPNERLAHRENLFQPLIEFCNKNNCRMAIVDARELQVDFNIPALFRAGVDAASMNKFGLCVALVARKDMLSSFFEDVTRNRGARVEVFTEMDRAWTWVNERQTGPGTEPKLSSAEL
jgi:hypothetical protein